MPFQCYFHCLRDKYSLELQEEAAGFVNQTRPCRSCEGAKRECCGPRGHSAVAAFSSVVQQLLREEEGVPFACERLRFAVGSLFCLMDFIFVNMGLLDKRRLKSWTKLWSKLYFLFFVQNFASLLSCSIGLQVKSLDQVSTLIT